MMAESDDSLHWLCNALILHSRYHSYFIMMFFWSMVLAIADCLFVIGTVLIQVVATASNRSPISKQLRNCCAWCKAVRPDHPARSKMRPHKSRTDQITILKCFPSFAVVVWTWIQMFFKIQKSLNNLTRMKSPDIFWARSPVLIRGMRSAPFIGINVQVLVDLYLIQSLIFCFLKLPWIISKAICLIFNINMRKRKAIWFRQTGIFVKISFESMKLANPPNTHETQNQNDWKQ